MTYGSKWLLAALALTTIMMSGAPQQVSRYPAHWWTPINDPHKPDWEILPQAAKPGEVIVSKRNELGILSNFAATPFTFEGKLYASVEGFWQMMLYPENASDPRATAAGVMWRYTRQQVSQMTSFEAKTAGTLAEANMRQLGIHWVTFESRRMPYRSMTEGEHYRLIREAMLAKLNQNPKVRETLLATGDLILRPDHIQEADEPPEWKYCQLWMEIRSDLSRHSAQSISGSVEFSDEPNFVVAGVRETAYTGGHGSDAGPRSAESLSKAAASLKTGSQPSVSSAAQAETSLRASLHQRSDDADLHAALAGVEEQLGRPLDAVHEYQRAAELQPSEDNLFNWGAELLSHDAAPAASEIFEKGMRSFPQSSRMLLGAAVAAYMRADYAQAVRLFFAASDLHPSAPEPYLFLANAQAPEIVTSSEYVKRLARFVELDPDNAWANYLYAMTQWDPKSGANDQAASARVQSALERAVRLDPTLARAWLQLGIFYSGKQDFKAAADAYEKAIAADPTLEQAHYRLAATDRQLGDTENARRETEIFNRLAQNSAQQREQERSKLQRFVIQLKKDR